MHQVNGAWVSVKVSLNRSFLGLVLVATATTIHDSEEKSQAKISQSLKDGEPRIEIHCSDYNVSNASEPSGVEIAELTTSEPESDGLLTHVGSHHEEKERSVEELRNKGDSGGLLQTFSLGSKTDPIDEHDAYGTQDVIDNG